MSDAISLVHRLQEHAEERGSMTAIRELDNDGQWVSYTWAEYWQQARAVGKGFLALGHQPGEIIAIVGHNRSEWVISQFGAAAIGGVIAPIYPTSTPKQTGYIVTHCAARIAVCDSEEHFEKFLSCQRDGHFKLEYLVVMDDIDIGDRAEGLGLEAMTLAELKRRGESGDDDSDGDRDAEVDARMDAIKPDELALLIFTSGTTGLPKGAEYTHESQIFMARALLEGVKQILARPMRYVSYLPLSHIAEQGITNFLTLEVGGITYFCRDIKKIKDFLVEARPTVFFAVPRVWEKFEAALRAKMGESTGIKAKLAAWAMKTELDHQLRWMETGKPQESWKRSLANKLVIGKIKDALGLDEIIVAASGAAPISRSTLEFFASVGVSILEGYGMTETTGFATVPPNGTPKFGTVGKPLPGVEVRIADDDEIMLRGKNMIRGYLKLPEQTAALYTDEWMHTGDLGKVDADGYLSITGRKKDIIITAGGKNVAPAEIEAHLQTIPGVGQAVVVGDRQPYLSALIALDPEALEPLCQAAGVDLADIAELAEDTDVRKFFNKRIADDCNSLLARYQTVKKFKILPAAFSVDTGELTPTLKVKRNVVNDKYADVILSMYE